MSKKFQTIILLALLCMLSTPVVYAVTAIPNPVNFTQPNGEIVTVKVRGDERIHWHESLDGYTLLFNQAGYLTYARLDENGNLQASDYIAADVEKRNHEVGAFLNTVEKQIFYSNVQKQIMLKVWQIEDEAAGKTPQKSGKAVIGSYKTICAFVQFPGQSMIKSMNEFQGLMNQLGYTGNGTGSVRDFFKESSYNKFDLNITLCGIYTAPKSESYYAGSEGVDNCPELAKFLVEKVVAESGMNFKDYDSDNDGYVDGFHFIFAGMGQEAGGGSSTIWSHKWGFDPPVTQNGVSLYIYSCSPELISGSTITTIGVICHEMTHAFGAPDFYDTNYDTDGQYEGTGTWDLMASGSWNGYPDGNRPALHNMYTKIQFGWVSPVVLNEPVAIENMPNSAENPVAYRINTTTGNEYFLLENRQDIKFDSDIPGSGLLIYHVHSDVGESGINDTHPQRMYPVCAGSSYSVPDSDPYSYGDIGSSECPFPGSGGQASFTDNTAPSMKSWAGANTNKPVTNIRHANGLISFDFMDGGGCSRASNMMVNYTADCSAQISWTAPYKIMPAYEGWIKYCVNDNVDGGLGWDEYEGNDMTPAIRFTADDLSALGIGGGQAITKIALGMGTHLNYITSMEIRIWEGGSSVTDPGTLKYTQPITNFSSFTPNAMNEITLNTPFKIDPTKELRIGYRIVNQQGYPIGHDAGSCEYEKGDLLYCADLGGWVSLYWELWDWYYNLSIKAFVTPGSSGPALYNVYRDGAVVASNITETSYTDKGFSQYAGHTWSVKVVCDGSGESIPVSVTKESCLVGIDENDNAALAVVPNPTSGQLRIESGELRIESIEVFDVMGRKQCSTSNFQFSTQIDISHLPAGVYFVQIQIENGAVTKKIIKN